MEFLRKIISAISGTGQKEKVFVEPTATPSDEELVELFVNGKDETAFEEILSRYVDKIYGLAFRITRDHSGAEEIVQEVFLAVWRSPDGYRAERGSVKSWLLGMVHHRAVDAVRGRHEVTAS